MYLLSINSEFDFTGICNYDLSACFQRALVVNLIFGPDLPPK